MMRNLVFNGFFVLIASISSAFFLFTFRNIFRCLMTICVHFINPQILEKFMARNGFFKQFFKSYSAI